MAFKHYFYQEQTRKYLLQFTNLFSGLRVRTGKRANGQSIFVQVPIRYSSMARMENMLSQGHGDADPDVIDQVNQSVPIMSTYMTDISLRPEARRGNGIIDRRTYLTIQDVSESADTTEQASKIRVKARAMPTPYMITASLNIWASNSDQHLQILEQLLMIFNPDITIQANDSFWDWTSLTKVTLTDIGMDTEVPIGIDQQIVGSTLIFDIPIWLAGPMIEIKGKGHVDAVRTNIRDGSEYDGPLDDLALDGSIADGITSDGTIIDVLGDPIDVNTDADGNTSGHIIPE